MRIGIAIVVLLLGGAARADWTRKDVVWLCAAETLIAADVAETVAITRRPDSYESNALLGAHPTAARVVAFGMLGGSGLAALMWALPDKYRWIAPFSVSLAETYAVTSNALVLSGHFAF